MLIHKKNSFGIQTEHLLYILFKGIYKLKKISKNKKMAVVEGFEPSTPGSEDQCSIQLSYTTV